jgi:Fe-S-cluster-containing dehydrogenase component/DMSO reductase anchor subunit
MHATEVPTGRRKATGADLGADFEALLEDVLSPSVTAIERFALRHGEQDDRPAVWSELIPLSAPGPGEQYAFEVDLDRCSSCKACVAACHSLNGLSEAESWRAVGTVTSAATARTVTVTSSCHHCEDPGCAAGCPVLAYEKDEKTGIVKHLDDQCIGCQYCLWTCPYDAPKYQAALGIVRKCDLCHGRLSAGEAPACVQSCPSQAIEIVTVARSSGKTNPDFAIPGTVAPDRTGPVTRYLTSHPLPADLSSPEVAAPRPEHAHAPLATLLVLTQWAGGTWLLECLTGLAGATGRPWALPAATALLLAGLAIGSTHLGRPLRAWKIFLGWRRSWFSREAVLLGVAAKFCLMTVLLPVALAKGLVPARIVTLLPSLPFLPWMASAALVAGLFCSTMLYVATPRPAWSRPATFGRFALTALGGGAVVLGAMGGEHLRLLGAVGILTGLLKAALVLRDRNPAADAHGSFRIQARLLCGPLALHAMAQLHLFLASLVAALVGTALGARPCFLLAVFLRLGSDLVERRLFFMACPATRMPGMRATGH